MFDHGVISIEERRRRNRIRTKLTKAWLKYYANWDGSDFRRDQVILKKVNAGKTPPNFSL